MNRLPDQKETHARDPPRLRVCTYYRFSLLCVDIRICKYYLFQVITYPKRERSLLKKVEKYVILLYVNILS